MKASILINNFNYGKYLGRAIDSALAQTYKDCEVIVVDDGSTDESLDVIDQYDDRIIKISKKNGGQASCFNAGYSVSSGDVVLFLDADDFFVKHKVSTVCRAISDIDIGWVFHGLERRGPTRSFPSERLSAVGQVDFRSRMKWGYMKFPLPATSALSFKREILARLLPMPEARGIAIGDHYLKFGAAGLARGAMLEDDLATQWIHDKNLYTGGVDMDLKARILLQTALALKRRVPEIIPFLDNLVGSAKKLSGGSPDNLAMYQRYLDESSFSGKVRVEMWFLIKQLFYDRIGDKYLSGVVANQS